MKTILLLQKYCDCETTIEFNFISTPIVISPASQLTLARRRLIVEFTHQYCELLEVEVCPRTSKSHLDCFFYKGGNGGQLQVQWTLPPPLPTDVRLVPYPFLLTNGPLALCLLSCWYVLPPTSPPTLGNFLSPIWLLCVKKFRTKSVPVDARCSPFLAILIVAWFFGVVASNGWPMQGVGFIAPCGGRRRTWR